MSLQRFFSVIDGHREVVNVSLLTGTALEWNEDRNKRTAYQVPPTSGGGWDRVGQITPDELLSVLRH